LSFVLSPEEIERYTRHLLLKEIGGEGQEKLKQTKILMVGAGGLGAPCLFYLAACGIGTIGIIDDDVIHLNNLQRQFLYQTRDLHQLKVERAKQILHQLNPTITIETYPERLTRKNVLALFAQYDLIADGSDNVETRLLVNDGCFFSQKPLVSAAVGQFSGQLASFRSFEKNAQNIPNPSWRCLVGEHIQDAENCEQGILGALCGVIGSLQALEIIKQITGAGDDLLNQLLLYDGLSGKQRIIRLSWDPHNPLNGRAPKIQKADFC